jgi:hypothetical protein
MNQMVFLFQLCLYRIVKGNGFLCFFSQRQRVVQLLDHFSGGVG